MVKMLLTNKPKARFYPLKAGKKLFMTPGKLGPSEIMFEPISDEIE